MQLDWSKCADASAPGVATLSCIPLLIQVVIYWLLVFAGIVALFMIIFAGFKFMNSGGDPKTVEGARKTLTYAIAGLVLVLLSFLIINIISQVTNVGCITALGFTSCH